MEASAWWARNYEFDYTRLHPRLNGPAAEAQAYYLSQLVGIGKDSRVLDVCGGAGRIAMPLAQLGADVTVLDLNSESLARGQKASPRGTNITWTEQDARKRYAGGFDVCISIFTSFGLFDSEEDNLKVLSNMFTALSDGGRVVIDVTNRDQRVSAQDRSVWKDVDGVGLVLERHEIDLSRSRWKVIRRFFEKSSRDVPDELYYDMRVYSPHEVRFLLELVGFRNVVQFRNLKGDPLDRGSWRHVTVATKQEGRG